MILERYILYSGSDWMEPNGQYGYLPHSIALCSIKLSSKPETVSSAGLINYKHTKNTENPRGKSSLNHQIKSDILYEDKVRKCIFTCDFPITHDKLEFSHAFNISLCKLMWRTKVTRNPGIVLQCPVRPMNGWFVCIDCGTLRPAHNASVPYQCALSIGYRSYT